MRTHTLIVLGLQLVGCSSGGYRQPAAAPSTFTAATQPSSPRDAAGQPVADLASALPDLQPQPVADLATVPPDIASAPDMASAPPDLATVPDLATGADMTPPPDMSPPRECAVVLKPPLPFPHTFTEGKWRWELGEIPRPDLPVDFLIDFEAYKLFDRYIITVDDPSCPRCPTWRADRWGPGRYSYHGASTAGWAKPVLTIEVSSGGQLDFAAFQLTAPCR